MIPDALYDNSPEKENHPIIVIGAIAFMINVKELSTSHNREKFALKSEGHHGAILSVSVASEVVVMTNFVAAYDDKVGTTTKFSLQCIHCDCISWTPDAIRTEHF